jgi:hypothetical protein
MERDFGDEGGGFWVVAILGHKVIWYNDIEGGFNTSTYKKYGQIDEYKCNQVDLNCCVEGLFDTLKYNRK